MPTNTQKSESLLAEIKRRSVAARLAWQKLTQKKPRDLPPISTQPNIG